MSITPMNPNAERINADYIYCLLNGRRMTLAELSLFSCLDMMALARALDCLRAENELSEYAEDGKEYLELRCGYSI